MDDKTCEEARQDATPEERTLDEWLRDDPRYAAEMDYWDAEEEVLDEMGWGW